MGKSSETRSSDKRRNSYDKDYEKDLSKIPTAQSASTTTPSITASKVAMNVKIAKDALEKARKAELVQKQIQEHLQKINFTKKLFPATSAVGVNNLVFDSLGRVLDESGNVVKSTPIIHSTLKVNRNLVVEKQKKESQIEKSEKVAKKIQQTQYIDPSLNNLKRKKKKLLKFVEPGAYIKQERQLLRQLEDRLKQKNVKNLYLKQQKLLEEQSQRLNKLLEDGKVVSEGPNDEPTEEAQLESAQVEKEDLKNLKLNKILENKDTWDDDEPYIEWWDRGVILLDGNDPFKSQNLKKHQYINNNNVSLTNVQINEDKLNSYIEHPVKLDGKRKKSTNLSSIQLTNKERKKLKRLRKQERQKIMRDKIIIGILPPPPPKLRMSNLINVLKNQSAADPSKVEQQVRQQMEQRLKAHEQRNQERKLTKEQKSKKNAQKWQVS